jgi:hypothetical protein
MVIFELFFKGFLSKKVLSLPDLIYFVFCGNVRQLRNNKSVPKFDKSRALTPNWEGDNH